MAPRVTGRFFMIGFPRKPRLCGETKRDTQQKIGRRSGADGPASLDAECCGEQPRHCWFFAFKIFKAALILFFPGCAQISFRRGMFAALDPSVNELYAFHGTFVRYALSIAENEAWQIAWTRVDWICDQMSHVKSFL